jgi:hypothetical protein
MSGGSIDDIAALVDATRPLFAGNDPDVQGAALADLVAIWIAGHIVPDDPQATEAMRGKFLELHVETVRRLIPVNERLYIEPRLRGKT